MLSYSSNKFCLPPHILPTLCKIELNSIRDLEFYAVLISILTYSNLLYFFQIFWVSLPSHFSIIIISEILTRTLVPNLLKYPLKCSLKSYHQIKFRSGNWFSSLNTPIKYILISITGDGLYFIVIYEIIYLI